MLHLAAALSLALAATTAALADPPIRFVEPADAAAHTDPITILDTRPIGDYLQAHLPGAVHIDDECLRGPTHNLPVQYCTPEAIAGVLSQAGVSFDTPVLVYADHDDPLAASMTAYALARLGHDDIRILAGGFGAWKANHPTTKAFPSITPTRLEPREPTINAARLEDFKDSIGTDDIVFIDARPAAHHRGDAGPWPRNGHIPGAHSLDWKSITLPDNNHRLIHADQIKQKLDDLDISPYDDIVVYCGTGREATLLTIALACTLDRKGVALYEGSWTQYSADPLNPVEVGPRIKPTTRVHTDGRFHLSGQPDKETLKRLAADGVTTIISCRTDTEMDRLDFDQPAFLEGLGLNYIHIPMGGHDEYAPHQLQRLASALAESDDPVLIHCASGGRARTLWMAYLIRHENIDVNDAIQRSLDMGAKPSSLQRILGTNIRYSID